MTTLLAQHTEEVVLRTSMERIRIDLPGGRSTVTLTEVRPGHTYHLIYELDDRSTDVLCTIGDGAPFSRRTAQVVEAATHELALDFLLSSSSFGWLSVMCKDCPTPRPAPPTVSRRMGEITFQGGMSAEELIRDVFIGGGCFDVSNVVFNFGSNLNDTATGMFNNGMSSIGMSSGIVLSTGIAARIEGPNDNPAQGDPLFTTLLDPDLQALDSTINLAENTVLEFDFVPTRDRIQFRYAFASEEYCQFIDTTFNDNFGLFISGPGINGPFTDGGENIAVIPGTSDFVSINTVNPLVNDQYYIDNVPSIFELNTNVNFQIANCAPSVASDDPANDLIQCNGFTSVFTATAEVIPCETYHIKLAIGDFMDAALDSWVFLEAGSFRAGDDLSLSLDLPGIGNTSEAYEGCEQRLLIDRLPGGDINLPVIIIPQITGSATPGVDYTPLPDTFIIPPGDTSLSVSIDVFLDDLAEGVEDINIIYSNPCRCGLDTLSFNLNDYAPPTVALRDLADCQETLQIIPEVSGGVPPYTYAWSTGDQTPTTMTAIGTTTYSLTITDDCGTSVSDTMMLIMPDADSFQISPDEISGCAGTLPAEATLSYVGTSSVRFLIERPDGGFDSVDATGSQTPYTITEAGTYTLVGVFIDGCPSDGLDQIEVAEGVITASPILTGDPCSGDEDFVITMNASSTAPPLTYSWSNGVVTTEDTLVLTEGDFSVTITDALGCAYLDTFFITRRFDAPIIVTQPLCGDTIGRLSLQADAPQLTYQFLPDGMVSDVWPLDLSVGSYEMVVSDPIGCTDTISVTIEASGHLDVDLPTLDTILEGQSIRLVPTINRDSTALTSSRWLPPAGLDNPTALSPIASPEQTVSYVLTVTDTSDCTARDTILIIVIPPPVIYMPNAFSPNNDGVNDYLYPLAGSAFSTVEEFSIYNRWGGLVMQRSNFPVNDQRFGWDGKANGEDLGPGVYTYYIRALRLDGTYYTNQGGVHLMR